MAPRPHTCRTDAARDQLGPTDGSVTGIFYVAKRSVALRTGAGREVAPPWVWQAARPHWESGNHDAAVWAAGVRVNTALQAKMARPHLGETKLVQEAFSITPPEPDKVRLRLCDDSNPDLYRDMHVGAITLGQGLFMGVRNPLNHIGGDDLDEQEALETLATWSLFARWVDRPKKLTGGG